MNTKYNLVCIHGNSQGPEVFQDFEVEGCQKILITLPGHGGRKLESVRSYLDMVESVYQDIKDIDRMVLVGLSLGAHPCHHLLDKVRPEALFSIAAPPLVDVGSIAKGFNPHPFLGYLFQNKINSIQASELSRSMLRDDHPRINELAEMILKTDPEIRGYLAASLTRGEFRNEVELIRGFQGKKVLIYPTQDNFINENYVKSVNVAPVKDIQGGHALTMDNGKGLAQFIRLVLFG